jgi:hypothetical protein
MATARDHDNTHNNNISPATTATEPQQQQYKQQPLDLH